MQSDLIDFIKANINNMFQYKYMISSARYRMFIFKVQFLCSFV